MLLQVTFNIVPYMCSYFEKIKIILVTVEYYNYKIRNF